jgi:hypothetical protein
MSKPSDNLRLEVDADGVLDTLSLGGWLHVECLSGPSEPREYDLHVGDRQFHVTVTRGKPVVTEIE